MTNLPFLPILFAYGISDSLEVVFTPEGLLLILLGTILGMFFGVIPGLGGAVAIALLIPLTFGMDSFHAFMILTASQGGSAFAGSTTAILLNIPGSPVNAATLLDGYPLTEKGESHRALGASAMASASGAVVGLIFLLLTLPILREMVLLFGPPEFFAISLFGLVIIAIAIKSSILKGMIAASLGMAVSFVGFSGVTGTSRYTFGTAYLLDGIDVVATLIGIFAISEMIKLTVENRDMISRSVEKGGNVTDGVKDVIKHYSIFFRSSLIGIVIGLIPGAGGVVANFVAYVQAQSLAPDSDSFGSGDIRGVIAAESANDAKDGGALIPTVAFGIPGSAAWAVMLGAFLLHGIQPGPQLMTDHLDVIFVIIISLLISNILSSVIGILLADQLVKVTTTPINILAPIIYIIALLGAFTLQFQMLDVVFTLIFGVIGYLMIKYGYSRIAFIIGLILGPIAENSFHTSLQISRGSYDIFYTRPITIFIFLLLIISLVTAIYKPPVSRIVSAIR